MDLIFKVSWKREKEAIQIDSLLDLLLNPGRIKKLSG